MPRQIRIMIESIEVPLTELSTLLAEPRNSSNDGDLRKAVAKLIEDDIASHLDTQTLVCRSGETATTKSVAEYIYPTEYEPAQIAPEDAKKEAAKINTGGAPTPIAFDTRDLGSTLEIQPTLGASDRIIDLRFQPTTVSHVRNEIWAQWKNPEHDVSAQMPIFFSQEVFTGLALINGEYSLAATMSARTEDGKPDNQRKILLFVRADVLKIGL